MIADRVRAVCMGLHFVLAASWLVCVVISGCATPPPKPPLTWDGLELVERENLDVVLMRPGASLAQYKRVMLRHAEVSFDQNWMPFKDPQMRSNKVDPNRIAREVETLFHEIATRELQQHSYEVVTYPDDDVLRVVPSITDLFVKFADPAASADGNALLLDMGHMNIVAELRDSMTNTVLARVVDRTQVSSADLPVRSSLTGAAAAERIITTWAVALRTALDRARAQPPAGGKHANSK
jgi:hypothetical protein